MYVCHIHATDDRNNRDKRIRVGQKVKSDRWHWDSMQLVYKASQHIALPYNEKACKIKYKTVSHYELVNLTLTRKVASTNLIIIGITK